MKRLDYFKRELNNILDRQLEALERKDSVSKSYIEQIAFMAMEIEKSLKQVGEISVYKDGSVWKKTQMNPPKWKCIRQGKHFNSETKGAKAAITKLKAKVKDCKNTDELLDVVMFNISRFTDNKGKVLPIVEELKKEVEERKKNIARGIVEKNEKGQLIYDDYNKLNDKQKDFVINDLLSRDYEEIGNGIFAETERKVKLGDKTFEKEFMDCQILRQIGFEKLFMLPQQYCVRTNGQTGNNTDTFAFKNGEKFDFIELKNPKVSNIKNLQEAYHSSLRQSKNVFIYYDNNVTNEEIWKAINGRIKMIKDSCKSKGIPIPDFTGNVFVCKTKENEVLQLVIKKYGLEESSSPSLESSQNLSKRGSFQLFRFSMNNIDLKAVSVNNKDVNKSINPYWQAVGI